MRTGDLLHPSVKSWKYQLEIVADDCWRKVVTASQKKHYLEFVKYYWKPTTIR